MIAAGAQPPGPRLPSGVRALESWRRKGEDRHRRMPRVLLHGRSVAWARGECGSGKAACRAESRTGSAPDILTLRECPRIVYTLPIVRILRGVRSRAFPPGWLRHRGGVEVDLLLAQRFAIDGRYAHVKVTDAGLVHLSGLTKLEWLGLGGTQITDAGLIAFSSACQEKATAGIPARRALLACQVAGSPFDSLFDTMSTGAPAIQRTRAGGPSDDRRDD